MEVWIANHEWGLHFKIKDKTYGGINIWGGLVPWRREVLKHALRAEKSPWINKEDPFK